MPKHSPETKQYQDRLLLRRQELQAVAESGAAAADTVELDQSRMGRLSRMDALQGQAMSREGKRRREEELQRIGAALQRIEDEEFGDCLRCGEPIAPGRLQFDPATPLCIDCAAGG